MTGELASHVSSLSLTKPVFIEIVEEEAFEGGEGNESIPSVEDLIKRYDISRYRYFSFSEDNQEGFGYDVSIAADECNHILEKYLTMYEAKHGSHKVLDMGVMTADDLNEDSYLVLHGDTHADLFAVIQRLECLREEGYLTADYKVANETDKKVKIVFLGDYFGRGLDGIKLFMFLLTLKMENWSFIDLYRGNHESESMVLLDVEGKEDCLLNDSSLEGNLLSAFSTLTLRGYYSCSERDIRKRKEHVVMAHGVPGFFPSAHEIFQKKRLVVGSRDKVELDFRFLEKSNLSKRDLIYILENLSEQEIREIEKSDFEKDLMINLMRISEFFKKYHIKILREWKKGSLIDLWSDVKNGKAFQRNNDRGTSFIFAPSFIKDICRYHSDTENKIVSVFKAHGHYHKTFEVGGKRKQKMGFINQQPITGGNEEWKFATGGVDKFCVLKVKKRVKDWQMRTYESKSRLEQYAPSDWQPFYGSMKEGLPSEFTCEV